MEDKINLPQEPVINNQKESDELVLNSEKPSILSKFRNLNIWKMKGKGALISFLFIIAILPIVVLGVQERSRIRNKAAEPPFSANYPFADNELAFIKTIYNKYLGQADTLDKVKLLMDPAIAMATPNITHSGDYNMPFRIMCTQLTVVALSKGSNLKADDPYVQYFVRNWNGKKFRSMTPAINTNLFVTPAATFDCLIAVNLLRGKDSNMVDIIPKSIRDGILEDLAFSVRMMAKNVVDAGGILPYYQKNAVINYGNSMAEEAQSMADFAIAVAKLMPKNAPGGLSDAERTTWENYGKTIGKWSFSKCPWMTNYIQACSLMTNSWMVTNHEFDPNPNYTLSLLTGISEMSMIYTQLGQSVPADLFTPEVKSAVNNITSSLKNYISDDFHFRGQFNKIEAVPSNKVITSFRYEDTAYTLNSEGRSQINSSIPRDRIDSANQYVIPNTSKVMSYITQGSRLWHYTCTIGSICVPEYQRANMEDEWRSRNILSPLDSNQATEWANHPLPNTVDTISQWYTHDKKTLRTYVYQGNRVWNFNCTASECRGSYTQPISWTQNNLVNAGWNTKPPPTDNIDAFTQYLVPGTGLLKSLIVKGNRVWMYDCDTVSGGGCNAAWTKDFSEMWVGINKTNWGGINPPIGSTDSIESFFSYVSPENTLKSYFTKGERMWAVFCSDWDFNNCQAGYTKTLTEFFQVIPYQFKWPQFPQIGVEQVKGVSEWGMDATYQNSAFAGMYLINPLNADWYQKLQTEQIVRGRKDRGITPLPINYNTVNSRWNYENFLGAKSAALLVALIDGEAAPFTLDVKQNAHWWMNMLAAKNHSMAYLSLTSTRGLLGQFPDDPNYILPTAAPTSVPTSVPTSAPTPRSCYLKGTRCDKRANCCNGCNVFQGRCR
jgi:hypothetical protein